MTKLRSIDRPADRQVETERQIISIRDFIGVEHQPMRDFSINTDDAFVKKVVHVTSRSKFGHIYRRYIMSFLMNIFRRNTAEQTSEYDGLKLISTDCLVIDTDKMNLNHLSSMARNVTQNHGTEPPFSSPLNSNKNAGSYTCVVCNTPVFRFIEFPPLQTSERFSF